ncbi:hypothetical protein F4861DRAFT_537780 [Xylaria intraflava]|nr:hypothetical protein F4861DRAFT_537780 [Xylaria intraflava]
MAIAASVPSGPTKAKLNYPALPPAGQVPYYYVGAVPEGEQPTNVELVPIETEIEDIRGRESEFTLDHDAFQVIQNVPPSKETEFVDDESIKKNYYPEIEKLLLDNIPGSNRVFIFDHTIRRSEPDAFRSPVQRVHIDQTPASAKVRVHRHLPDEAEELLKGRYRIVNVWRSLNKKPIEAMPLAYASSASLADKDVFAVEHRHETLKGASTAGISFSPNQKWYYLSGMVGSEYLLLECFDSEGLKEGSGVAGGRAAHTAFDHPLTKPDAIGRESIEIRTLVFGP